ncbi:MAG: 50S ribosomal protein L23 [Candidatus Uhrbacteria bacterium GW2011_GWE2_45_35]|uniref:Large ribosomal subunit protein uL23 n=2 Tax=Candidatus Uhriibacteriota TaxID=1752732 RepID=A0A0G1JKU0_9BACT|nr:MAG: 50S ribosomal protein L23 [Candidatus Uhrbacteria bacterium GW2011_GWF2_44_350]KKU09229.1 MAG: 50S ribosomal protein L23 [Candidatus Uhrbacteria bacterium GW2011_GWE2_45_35]HBR80488.1 50S ribosomal protein L23 [Candidatus Uhrbacteria bacterium]HCU31527.1 50S ribosomal protein L23 [Candidatus Uhrbacteria bacterium]
MGFLDRFKNQKEQELEGQAVPVIETAEKKAAKSKTKIEKKSVESADKKDKPATKASKKIIPDVLSRILFHPLVTEKSAVLASSGQYIFEVNPKANRLQVAEAVEAVYGVKPVKVKIQNVRREPVRFGRFHGKQKLRKKAIVCLPKGKTINVHEGV